jgi:uncharacterized delta-60 repeat protein
MPVSRLAVVAVLVCSLVFAAPGPVVQLAPQPGDLDLSFGDLGRVTTQFDNILNHAAARDVLVLPNGKIVAVGYADNFGETSRRNFALMRYNADGTLDTSFGPKGKISPFWDGIVTTDFNNDPEEAWDAVLQPDGKIVAVGIGKAGPNDIEHFGLIARYTTLGFLDLTFADGGRLWLPYGPFRAVVLQPDGKIVAAGETSTHNDDNINFSVWRFNADGSSDPAFDWYARKIEILQNARDNGAYALAQLPDGKFLVAGYTDTCCTGHDFAMVKLNADGTTDNAFGTTARVYTDVSGGYYDEVYAMAVQKDGKILLAGRASVYGAVVRYNPDGSLDSSFGIGGKLLIQFDGLSEIHDIKVLPNGKILVAGWTSSEDGRDFALARFNTDGSLDEWFSPSGQYGIATTDFPALPNDDSDWTTDEAFAVAIQPDGKIVAAGGSNPHNTRFALARYHGDPPPARVLHANAGAVIAIFQIRDEGMVYRISGAPVTEAGIYESEFGGGRTARPLLPDLASEGTIRDAALIDRLEMLTRQGRATLIVKTGDEEVRATLQAEPK